LFLVSAAQFVLQLDFSIVNVALATIQREFGVSAADLQWLVTGYALTCTRRGRAGRGRWASARARPRPGRRPASCSAGSSPPTSAGGLFAAAQQVGMALGLAVLATIAAGRTRSATAHGLTVSAALVSGYRLAYLVGAVIVACAVLVTLFFLRPARPARPARTGRRPAATSASPTTPASNG
jgi:MFS family permease